MQNPLNNDTRRAWVDVDLDSIVANARSYAVRAGVQLLPMVKADAYGLGADRVTAALAPLRPFGWGVATVDEAIGLRRGGRDEPIVVFTPALASQVEHHLIPGVRPVLADLEALTAWIGRGAEPFHVEIDTGMSRSGFKWDDSEVLRRIGSLLVDGIEWEGVFTQFHSADTDPAITAQQWQRLEQALATIGQRPRLIHAANSAAVGVAGNRFGADLARPGIHLYGGAVPGLSARPVVALRARVVALRRLCKGDTVSYGAAWVAPTATTVATLAIGYADGVSRHLGGRGLVEFAGQVCPMVGRVTMDQVMVDVGDQSVRLGDVATLFGGVITLDQQARLAGTIGYELLTSLGPRLPRRYSGGS